MLADFYIPRLSNDMKIAVPQNHLVGQILLEVWSLLKNGVITIYRPTSSPTWKIQDF